MSNRNTRYIAFSAIPIALILAVIPLFILLAADEGSTVKSQTLIMPDDSASINDSSITTDEFIELHLTPEGAYGVDEEGHEWDYDFTRDTFIRHSGDSGRTQTVFGRRETVEIPEVPEIPDVEGLRAEKLAELKQIKGLKLGAVVIGVDEKVIGPVVAVGPVTVRGVVVGDVISYKKITVTSTGEIQGDARAPEIVKMRGGTITGSRIENDFPAIPEVDIFSENRFTALIAVVVIWVGLLICGLLVVGVIPMPISRIKACLQQNFIKSFFIGLLILLAFGPVMALLSLTVIGIPIALIALPIGLCLAVIFGIVGMGSLIGDIAAKYYDGLDKSQLVKIIFGISIMVIFWLFMALLMIKPGSVTNGFATLFLVLSIIIWSFVVSAGLGAVVMTRFGKRECGAISIEIKVDRVQPPPPPTPPPLNPNDNKIG
nr:polymer-forming cytoskeletal protein [candidate division Zixibacteria bacterium]